MSSLFVFINWSKFFPNWARDHEMRTVLCGISLICLSPRRLTHWVSILIGGPMRVSSLTTRFSWLLCFLIQFNTCPFFIKMKANIPSIRLLAVSTPKFITTRWFWWTIKRRLLSNSYAILFPSLKYSWNHKLRLEHHISTTFFSHDDGESFI